jgi:hypothetical protein
MNIIMFKAFVKEASAIQVEDKDTPPGYLETRVAVMRKLAMHKQANMLSHGAELAGLGILAKPSYDELRGKRVPETRKAGMEMAGLGVLAAPSAISMGRSIGRRLLAR